MGVMIKLMTKMIALIISVAIGLSYSVNAQIGINTDGTDPDNSAILDVKSTDKGLLPPRMTTAQIVAIESPAEGLMVYNTDTKSLFLFNGTLWGGTNTGFLCGDQIMVADGNIYNTVLMGTQCWMKENLRTTTYSDGTPIPNVTDVTAWSNLTTGAYTWYDNDISWKEEYGALYNWYATVDANLCPTGWHVPTDSEWTILTDYIGGPDSPHGNELKSCRQVNSPSGGNCNTSEHPRWNESSTQYGTDDYGFSGLPSGYRKDNGYFYNIGGIGAWWSSTQYVSYNAWVRYLSYGIGNVGVDSPNKKYGYSVRCLKD